MESRRVRSGAVRVANDVHSSCILKILLDNQVFSNLLIFRGRIIEKINELHSFYVKIDGINQKLDYRVLGLDYLRYEDFRRAAGANFQKPQRHWPQPTNIKLIEVMERLAKNSAQRNAATGGPTYYYQSTPLKYRRYHAKLSKRQEKYMEFG